MPIRVLLADDHALVRAGFRALMTLLNGIEVVGEAGDGQEALRLIEALSPDLVLLDIAMPRLNGLEVAARVAKERSQVRLLIISMHASEEYVGRALRAGAHGYLLKGAGLSELDLAVRAVMRGEVYLSPSVSRHVVQDYVRRVTAEEDPLLKLTPRQREVLQLIAEGWRTQQIAALLHISPKTVETHRGEVMARLGIRDIPGLVRFAIRRGLIQADG